MPKLKTESNYIFSGKDVSRVEKLLGFNLDKYDLDNKIKILRNCVLPDVGLAIFESALNIYNHNKVEQVGLFALPSPPVNKKD